VYAVNVVGRGLTGGTHAALSKVIPVISREVLQVLLLGGDVEVEPMRVGDVERDLTAIMREYLTNEDRVNQATRKALERRGYDYSKFHQVKLELADVYGFRIGDEGIQSIANEMARFLLVSVNVEEVFAPDDVLRQKILAVMTKHLGAGDVPRTDDPNSGHGGVPPATPGSGTPPTGTAAVLDAPDERAPDETEGGAPEYQVDDRFQ
jgi:uncharacterized protein